MDQGDGDKLSFLYRDVAAAGAAQRAVAMASWCVSSDMAHTSWQVQSSPSGLVHLQKPTMLPAVAISPSSLLVQSKLGRPLSSHDTSESDAGPSR